MSDNEQQSPMEGRREWRDLHQDDFRRTTTTEVARRRKWRRIWRWVGFTSLALFFCFALVYASVHASKESGDLDPVTVVSRITLRTDGVLNDKWISRALDMKRGMDIDKLDVAAVRAKLLAIGQVKSAAVTLKMPGELVVELREQSPVMKARVQLSPGIVKTLLISREGVVYEGFNYPDGTLRALPWVEGLTIRKNPGGKDYAPLTGLEPVTNLLETARTGWPYLYRDWNSVSLARYKGADSQVSLLEVTTRSTPVPIVRIDLSLDAQAIVEYQTDISGASNTSTTTNQVR
jgi:cell division septal protein FtsQ